MSTRDAIARALSTVPGVTGQATPPDLPGPGTAWPAWAGATPGTNCGLTDQWFVFLVLPNPTIAATVEAADALVDATWAALLDVGEVSIVEPAQITPADPAGAGQALPALRFTMTTVGVKT